MKRIQSVIVEQKDVVHCPYCGNPDINQLEYLGFTIEGCLWYCFICEMEFERILSSK